MARFHEVCRRQHCRGTAASGGAPLRDVGVPDAEARSAAGAGGVVALYVHFCCLWYKLGGCRSGFAVNLRFPVRVKVAYFGIYGK